MSNFTETVELEGKTCGKCGGVFALNKEFLDFARKNAGGYHCPYCQNGWGWHESEADKLKKQLEQRERELRESKCETLQRQQLLEREVLSRQQAEKKLRRVNKGVCPCCNRTFQNLQRHMASKHKDHPKVA